MGVQAEKQKLSDTFLFGHLLQDICDGLNTRTTLEAPLPIHIPLRQGKVLTRGGDRTARSERGTRMGMDERYPLANLRVEAELLMFIAQTGMNLGTASGLKLQHFFYVGHIDGYQVKEYKARRGGAVLFEIFKEYKPHFERYLAWRRVVFPKSDRLFPFFNFRGGRADACVSLHRLYKACRDLDVPYVSPRSLRSTRVNWLLRMSANPDLTAEMAQHTKQTLHKQYERASLQRAMVQATRFWSKVDPDLSRTEAVAPGGCAGGAKKSVQASKDVPKPDCLKASGCFWCANHRDVDSLDYVWGLSTFRHLKVIELSKTRLPQRDGEVPPAKLVIDRLDEKLRWFEESTELRLSWVEESRARVNEGDFHPDLRSEISELEEAI
ncbi:site-specific integrase [Burkholderia ubonensis]|uniref:site-specific integrase n=1 Tax=Burkholderia ubonensis TaxID=101571 RepID=UPI000F5723CD|nr:site-specific integrase [Burkholderia ubonensis]